MVSEEVSLNSEAATKNRRKWLDKVEPYLWVLPAILVYFVFKIAPLFAGFYLSLLRWDGLEAAEFVGLQNFQRIMADNEIGLALFHNLHYAFGTVTGKIILSLGLALLLNHALRGRTFYRTALFLPVVMSFVVVGVLWTWMFDAQIGMINALLRVIALDTLTQDWLGNTRIAMWSLILVDIWKWYGFHMVIFVAGLQAIPEDLYESAMVDGASRWLQFWAISLPLLRPVMLINVTLSLMGAFNVFDIPFIMTGGGPANSTLVMALHVYIRGFKFYKFGYASALSIVLLVLVALVAAIQMRMMSKED